MVMWWCTHQGATQQEDAAHMINLAGWTQQQVEMWKSYLHTVDGNQKSQCQAPGMVLKPCKQWDFTYQPQLVNRISSIHSNSLI